VSVLSIVLTLVILAAWGFGLWLGFDWGREVGERDEFWRKRPPAPGKGEDR
jgi:hypothetical protein